MLFRSECILKLTISDISGEKFILSAGEISYKDFLEKVAPKFHKKAPSTLVPSSLTSILWRLEAIRTFFTGNAPLITKETALSSSHSFIYQNEKIKQTLGFEFKNLEESLDRICGKLMEKYK